MYLLEGRTNEPIRGKKADDCQVIWTHTCASYYAGAPSGAIAFSYAARCCVALLLLDCWNYKILPLWLKKRVSFTALAVRQCFNIITSLHARPLVLPLYAPRYAQKITNIFLLLDMTFIFWIGPLAFMIVCIRLAH